MDSRTLFTFVEKNLPHACITDREMWIAADTPEEVLEILREIAVKPDDWRIEDEEFLG